MGSVDTVYGKENDSDKFSYYARAIAEVLAEDDDDDKVDDCKRLSGSFSSISPCGQALGSVFSDSKRERLKILLGQSVTDLKPKVDEMFEPVLNMNKLQTQLRCKKQQQDLAESTLDLDNSRHPPKKRKFASSMSTARDSTEECPANDVDNEEVDEDLRLLLNTDISNVEEIIKKYSDDLSATLEHMRLNLEKILNNVMSKCRSMSAVDKLQLQRRIQDLPEDNLVRVSEILQCNAESEDKSRIFVNLNEADNTTLWRLYCHVESVKMEKARVSADKC